MGDPGSGQPLLTVGVAFGVVGTAGCILITIIFGLLLCLLWRRTRGEIRLLKNQVERGSANMSADPNMAPLATMESATSDVPNAPAPLLIKPSITDTSRGYSSVNKLSLLPDEVRTATNLEGETMPPEMEAELIRKYERERADYEEKQLLKMAEMKAKRGVAANTEPQVVASNVVPVNTTPPQGGGYDTFHNPKSVPVVGEARTTPPQVGGYDTIAPFPNPKSVPVVGGARGGGTDPYEDPADAVSGKNPGQVGVAKKSGGSPITQQKKMSVGVTGALGMEYTPVFNTLPEGQVETIHTQGHGKSGRALSDSSPTRKSPHSTKNASFSTSSYENSPTPSKTTTPTHQESPASGDAPVANNSSPDEMRRQDSTRHSNRKAAKEVVEFDPSKPRKFRVSTGVKKPSSGQKIDEVDGILETSQGSEEGGVVPARTKSFSIQAAAAAAGDKGQLSYAMVNMVDKRKNRAENDGVKTEGSGVPQHYRVPISTTS